MIYEDTHYSTRVRRMTDSLRMYGSSSQVWQTSVHHTNPRKFGYLVDVSKLWYANSVVIVRESLELVGITRVDAGL